MSKRIEAVFAVVATCAVGTDAAEGYFLNDLSADDLVIDKHIKRQGFGAVVDFANSLIDIGIDDDRQKFKQFQGKGL